MGRRQRMHWGGSGKEERSSHTAGCVDEVRQVLCRLGTELLARGGGKVPFVSRVKGGC